MAIGKKNRCMGSCNCFRYGWIKGFKQYNQVSVSFCFTLILTKAVLSKGKDGRGHLPGHYTRPAWSSQKENCMYPNIFLVDTLRYTGWPRLGGVSFLEPGVISDKPPGLIIWMWRFPQKKTGVIFRKRGKETQAGNKTKKTGKQKTCTVLALQVECLEFKIDPLIPSQFLLASRGSGSSL